MLKALSHSTHVLLTTAFILIMPVLVIGQGSTPARGFQPGGSYALSDIETINTTNGNLILNLTLGKLSPGRGGLSGQLSLHYDSKLYDSRTQYYEDWEHPIFGQPQVVIRNMLMTSDQGGWHYGTGYELQLIDRMSQYPPEIAPQYPATETIRHYKVKVAFPDGSVHEFLPRGFGSPMEEGYYDIRPDGWQTRFTGGYVQDVPYLTNTLTYYTFDGTYIKLEVQHDSDGNWWNNPWSLYFPDGTKVTNFGTRITDRNGNYVEWSNVTYNGHPATQLMDQLGRKILIENQGISGGDVIHVPGVGGADLTYQVHWKSIQVFKTYSTDDPGKYDENGYPSMLGYQFVVSQIDLPEATGGLQYVFGYNAADYGSSPCCTPSYGWGELSSVTLPTGAQAQYQYLLDGQNGPGFGYMWTDVLNNHVTRKSLTYQQQYDGNSTPVTETWNYDISIGMATIVMPDGGVMTQLGQPIYRTDNADGSISEKIWQANRPQGFPSSYAPDPATGIDAYDPQRANQYLKTEFTSIRDAGGTLTKTAIKDYSYDKNGNVAAIREYDWVDYSSVPRNGGGFPTGIPGSAVLKRVTTNSYANSTPDASDTSSNDADSYWNSTAPALKNVVASSEVSNGSTTLTRAEFFYDNSSTTGNLTQQKHWDSTKAAYSNPLTGSNSISTSIQYDQYGNPTLTTDARGVQTRLVYGSVGGFTDLYPTQIKTAYQTSVQRTETREYDFYTGATTRTTDVDNNVANSTTYDVFGRPTLVKAAEGKPEETRTSTSYSDVNRRVIVKSDLNTAGDEKLVSIQHYDQLGRVRLTRQLEDAATQSATDETTGIKVQTRYQYSGNFSYVLTSNTYRAATSASAGGEATMGWSRSKSDNGGRVIEVQTFGGATAPAPWGGNTASTGSVSSTYDAHFTTVTDQAGKVRRSMTDALGRLVRVDEPDAGGNLGSTTSPVQPTSYDYDALGNLITANQGVQTRSFNYSSLSRLTSVSNPESGTVSYQYDNNGNLSQKTDARNIVTIYEYDALNRNTSVNYSNTTIGNPDVPDITRFYDGATNGKGRFWYSYTSGNLSIGSNVEHTSIDNYDALGRPLVERQLFKLNGSWGPTYQTSRAYNQSGRVTTQTYPSGHAVTYNYDGAGRLADKDAQNLAFTGNLGDGVQRTYASGISYVSSGALQQEQFGTTTAVYNKLLYNSRLQLAEIRTGTAGSDWNRGKILNDYSLQCSGVGCNATDNDGNLRKQQLYIPGDDQVSSWTSWYQQYDYDSLNRLKRVHEYTGNTQLDWQQEYDYDRWGNRTLNASGTWIGNAGNPPSLALNETAFETGNLAATNRLYAPGDLALPDNQRRMRYDAAGNLSVDSYTGAGERVYDAENRMTQAWGNNQWQYYTYNADGQRTRRKINNQETWQIYGFEGELLAEYRANATMTTPQKEYGYRNGQLLVTAEPNMPVNVSWTNAVGVSVNVNSLTKTAGTGWGNAGATSAQSITAGDGYVELTVPDTTTHRFLGLSNGNSNSDYTDVDFAIHPVVGGTIFIYEGGISRGTFGSYTSGDVLRVGVEGGVVKYRKNGALLYTSTVTPTYPLLVDTALHGTGDTLSNVVISGAGGYSGASSSVHWLVADHLGTPRIVIDQTGSLSNITRHDYLPFGEELNIGLRTPLLGYSVGDSIRQQFTSYERDIETTLDFAKARYYSGFQGRFTSVDPLMASANTGNPQTLNRYIYTINRPLSLIDPTGMFGVNPGGCVGGDLPQWAIAPGDELLEQKRKPKPKKELTVRVTAGEVTFDWNMGPDRSRPNVGPFFTGFSSVLTIVLLEDGKPVVGATGTESVTGSKGEKIERNPMPVTTNANGEIFDLVSRGAIENFKVGREIAIAAFNENSSKPVDVTTLQTITLDLPGGGTAEIKFKRRITNLDENGNIRASGPPGIGRVSNFTVTIGTPTIRRL
jgi:RHS repeat-associated protein